MDNLDFLDAGEPVNGDVAPTPQAEAPSETVTEAAAETPAAPEAEQKGPSRGPDGKFAKKDEPVMVPLAALHEARDELRALKARMEQLSQPQQQASPVPDIFENPEGFTGHIQSQIAQATLNTTLNISEEITRQSAGSETVDQDPALYQQFLSQRNPYGWLVSEYQRQSAMSQIGSDPKQIEAFLAWQQAQQAQPQPAATAAPPQPQRPTGSIASAVSAGGAQHTAMGPGVAFDNVIR
jgi:hypothetical protein